MGSYGIQRLRLINYSPALPAHRPKTGTAGELLQGVLPRALKVVQNDEGQRQVVSKGLDHLQGPEMLKVRAQVDASRTVGVELWSSRGCRWQSRV